MKIQRKGIGEKFDAVVIPIFKNTNINEILAEYPSLNQIIKNRNFGVETGENLILHAIENGILCIVLGGGRYNVPNDGRKLARYVMTTLKNSAVKNACIYLKNESKPNSTYISNLVDYLYINNYCFNKYKSEVQQNSIECIRLYFDEHKTDADQLLNERELLSRSIEAARDLVNEPSSVMTPDYMVRLVREQAKSLRWKCCILRGKELEEGGWKGISTIGKASPHEPALLKITYTPKCFNRTISIVGKGITFDSGGLNIKTPDFMKHMKSDMAGAAAALGIIKAASDLALPVRIHAVIAIAENMPGSASYKPGDIISFKNGTTVEVSDTDAEGRLVLADSLLWAAEDKPDAIIELSTLTGWVYVALGDLCAGFTATDPDIAVALSTAGRNNGEYLLELPLLDEYKADITSKVADLRNYDYNGAHPIKGGLFLTQFVENIPFIHIDIGGTAFLKETNAYYSQPGATGFGIKSIIDYLRKAEI